MSKYLLTMITLMSLSTPLQAHLLKVFAYSTGDEVIGSVYFAGGNPAGDVELKVSGATGKQISTLRSDDEGGFRYPITHREAQHIKAYSGDGHSAQWIISKTELAATPGSANNSENAAGEPGNPAPHSPNLPDPSANTDTTGNPSQAGPPSEISEAIVERALARQLGPLRLQLEQQQAKARLSDILGGLGIIFGLAGFAMWWRSRRLLAETSTRSSSPHSSPKKV